MKVVDEAGREHPWPPPGHTVLKDDRRPRSELHLRCRALLREMYPTQPILEEVPIPGMRLFCDFYLPFRQVVVECHGEQHYKFNAHFHGERRNFVQSRNRDQRKVDWCYMNNFGVAILPFNESDDDWRDRIENADD